MKTTIYFMRHGEVDNPKQILYGRLKGFSLTEAGKKKIAENVRIFNNFGINRIYSSPMLRARQTAQIMAKGLKLKVSISSLLNEVDLLFKGISLSDYKNRIQPDLYNDKYIKKGQESIEKISERMIRFTRKLIKRYEGGKILVISHGDPILILKAVTSHSEFTWDYKRQNYLFTGQWLKVEIENGRYNWVLK